MKVYTLFWQNEREWCWYCSRCGHTFVTDENPHCNCGSRYIKESLHSIPCKNYGPTFIDIGYFYCPYVPMTREINYDTLPKNQTGNLAKLLGRFKKRYR